MEKFGSVFFQGYGQTESGPEIAFLKERDHEVLGDPEGEKRLLYYGYTEQGVHVRIVDQQGNDMPPGEVGEIIVKSRHLMREYWKKPEETEETIVNGWLHTGDIAKQDEEGFLYIGAEHGYLGTTLVVLCRQEGATGNLIILYIPVLRGNTSDRGVHVITADDHLEAA